MLETDRAVLVVVDMQVKLLAVMHQRQRLLDSAARLIRGMTALEVPILWTEQNPAGLGPTAPELASLLPPAAIPKLAFSCWGEAAFRDALQRLGRRQVVLAGMESHVCVCQTALDLLQASYEVHVATDAVSSRTAENRQVGLDRAAAAGAVLTSTEAALFELLRVAQGPKFKAVLKIVR